LSLAFQKNSPLDHYRLNSTKLIHGKHFVDYTFSPTREIKKVSIFIFHNKEKGILAQIGSILRIILHILRKTRKHILIQ